MVALFYHVYVPQIYSIKRYIPNATPRICNRIVHLVLVAVLLFLKNSQGTSEIMKISPTLPHGLKSYPPLISYNSIKKNQRLKGNIFYKYDNDFLSYQLFIIIISYYSLIDIHIANYKKKMTTAVRPKVLRLGNIDFAQAKWDEVAKIADVIDCESQNREEFIKDLQTKYKDITNIARTYASVKQTGRFDAELASHMPQSLKSVSHNGAGYDQIDRKSVV